MTEPPPHASARCPEVPRELDAVLEKMMAKEPKDRPASLGEALDLLARAGESGGIALESGRLPAPASTAADSHRALATVPTMVDDGSSSGAGPVAVVARAGAAQTFLDAESDVPAATKPKRRWLPFAAAGGLAAVVAVAAIASLPRARTRTPEPAATAIVQASAVAASSSSSSSSSPPPAEPEPPREVQLRVEGAPAGATVTADGAPLGAAPGPFALKPGVETKLVIAAKGYKSRELTITPASDVVVPVTLDKAAAAPAGKPGKAGKGNGISPDLEGFDSK
jgi:serine/threonine-protein kinase